MDSQQTSIEKVKSYKINSTINECSSYCYCHDNCTTCENKHNLCLSLVVYEAFYAVFITPTVNTAHQHHRYTCCDAIYQYTVPSYHFWLLWGSTSVTNISKTIPQRHLKSPTVTPHLFLEGCSPSSGCSQVVHEDVDIDEVATPLPQLMDDPLILTTT